LYTSLDPEFEVDPVHRPDRPDPSLRLLDDLNRSASFVAAELRPPRAELESAAGMDAWIDTYHAVRALTRTNRFVLLTDSAVGAREEDNLRHLVTNLGEDVPRELVVPFLTCKHPLDYCLAYPERARQHGFQALVVLGGDRYDEVPRCVEHAWQLRRAIRNQGSTLALGGWANPYADPVEQVSHLAAPSFTAEFYLTQIVSHHGLAPVRRFLAQIAAKGVSAPGIFGVFFYRSASPRTLRLLQQFIPVPADELTREFAEGASAEQVCARTIRAMADLGIRRFYISNLPLDRASTTLVEILERAGLEEQ
jgi:5,10-methylenetetrahydrofolate reductase